MASVRYGILGPLTVAGTAITAGRDRIVLAMLLLQANRVVGVSDLIDAIWEEPPSTARNQLQTCVSRLRRQLPPDAIVSDPAGYRLCCDPDDLDAAVFTRLVSDPARLREALDLWRGPALGEIDSPAVHRQVAVLDEMRAVAIEDWADLELSAGRERALLGELAGLVERYPLRERLRGQLMTALHRSGRQADALAEYRRGDRVLRDELGIEPGRELRELHDRILGGDTPEGRARCLPRTVGDFTGREAVVRRLVGAIDQAGPYGPAVLAVDGMAGSGKTTLALHLAALVGDRYPDAHLFVDLHGHSDHEPLEPSAALLLLLSQLGVPVSRMPAGTAGRIDMWRTEIAKRRVLVLLDNAASSAQVADLLPTSPGALAVVTSRRRLVGLDGVHPESLPVLTEDEAVALLARIAGGRVSAQPAEAAELVRRCGGLPLALRLAGARLAHRPRWQVADLVRRIGSAALPELAAESRTVAGAFALSFSQLAEPAQRLFRQLGTFPGRSFDVLTAAAVSDLPLDDAEDLLDDLVDAHLVEEPEPRVFRLHDLLREYAGMLAAELPADARAATVERALDLEVHAAVAATPFRLTVTLHDLGDPVPQRPDLVAELADPEARLERTRPVLGAFADAALAIGRPDLVWSIARASWRYLWKYEYNDDILLLFTLARDVARREGNVEAQAMTANYLASAHHLRGANDVARALLDECIRLRREMGDLVGVVIAVTNLGALQNLNGNYAEAVDLMAESLRPVRRETMDTSTRLDVLSTALAGLGRHAEAIHIQRRRLMVALEDGGSGVAQVLEHLIMARIQGGDIAPAVAERNLRVVLRALANSEEPTRKHETQRLLGEQLCVQGRYAEAVATITDSLAGMQVTGANRTEATAHNSLGQALLASGDTAAALVEHHRALEIARTVGSRPDEARAHAGLGDCLIRTDPVAAGEHWQRADRMFAEMQSPERAGRHRGGADHLRSGPRRETMVP
ncbi:DNA-binding SARP family transcriptional activator/tetratricopeptide (TPR) repeat protein [Actinoplanes tereljensis]|uniref:SARP family transcriptional regulator n=1 Tax=Paractinoplanes tereljensis TaxID=571912 RepID=A0A919TXP3_9ACTN|nr:AfsR/SARP family transcriptional regulator [Actinoplanes tereljensis]GIF24112.1 SARP family transcriptional regulator [Actinoplanes tereljensis]